MRISRPPLSDAGCNSENTLDRVEQSRETSTLEDEDDDEYENEVAICGCGLFACQCK